MNASKELVLPQKKEYPNYPNKLYNHIIDIYEKNNLYVDKTSLPFLEELRTAIRNVLQCTNSRVAKGKIPEIFNHNITSSENKVRISQKFVYGSANSFLCPMHKGNCSF